ncbi:TetR/AcrR family transcriptional regulator [Lentibacillus saliphilus]|uniref:TetR/AcrR family transcriptional regulator n=1 Tax=Lentibacillus saliphilus TaxID=2737028 RepID=UPI001C2FA619|nr:TetR/AcrR family transcriptional regulator [Lentibacillus saliphilus]
MNNNEMTVSSVKDEHLIKKRRAQMIKGALTLFKEKGFHKTTTREIAKESGFSIGTLYEYIRTKEDVLYFVCESIYEQVHERLEATIDLEHASLSHLKSVMTSYFYLMDQMQEEIVIMYQEAKSLSKDTKSYVLQKERDMVSMLERVIVASVPDQLPKRDVALIANNIFIQGQMWGFRRWMLHNQFTLEAYIDRQIHYLFQSLGIDSKTVN